MCFWQLNGFHISQQCQSGAVPRKHCHGLQGGAARGCSAARQWLRSCLGQLHLSAHMAQHAMAMASHIRPLSHSNRDTSIATRTAMATLRMPAMTLEGAASWEGDDEAPADQHPRQGTPFIRSQQMLSPGYYEHIRQILHNLNGHGNSSRMVFQFSYHTARNHVMVTLHARGGWRWRKRCPCFWAACVLYRVQARPCGYNRRSRPEGPIWRWDVLGQAAVQPERQLLLDLKKQVEADIIVIINIITATTTIPWSLLSCHTLALGTSEVMASAASSKG